MKYLRMHQEGRSLVREIKNSSFRRLEINSSPTYLCRLEDSRHVLVDVEWPLCTMSVSPKPITIYIQILKAICIVRLTLWDTGYLRLVSRPGVMLDSSSSTTLFIKHVSLHHSQILRSAFSPSTLLIKGNYTLPSKWCAESPSLLCSQWVGC